MRYLHRHWVSLACSASLMGTLLTTICFIGQGCHNWRYEDAFRGSVEYSRLLPESLRTQVYRTVASNVIKNVNRIRQPIAARFVGAKISDEDLNVLAAWHSHWTDLWLSRSEVTNHQLTIISKFDQLMYLDLREGLVDSEGLQVLRGFPHLAVLLLGKCPIDDQAAMHIATCKKLVFLDVSDTLVTDQFLAEVARMPSLRRLDLCGCDSIDIDSPVFAQLKHVKLIFLDPRLGQPSVIKALKEGSPGIDIVVSEEQQPIEVNKNSSPGDSVGF